jgi:hypothetical protein
MTEGVKEQEPLAEPVQNEKPQLTSDNTREHFRRLEQAKEDERERRVKAEMENALMKQRLEMLEIQNRPQEKDPLADVQDYVDPTSLKAAFAQERQRLTKEAENIADRKLKEWKQQEDKRTHLQRLKSEYPDFGSVVNEDNVVRFEQSHPEFVQSLLYVEDEYERKKLAYNFFKRNTPQPEAARPSIKEKVEENSKNPYMIASGSGVPGAVEYDLKSPQARQAAYAKLKAAQRNPLGGNGGSSTKR